MKPGLYLWTQQSGNLDVVRIGWIRRVDGDEYEALNMVTPLRKGDYKTLWSDVHHDGPPKTWDFSRPIPMGSPLNRFQIRGPVPLKPEQWTKVCPKPRGWE